MSSSCSLLLQHIQLRSALFLAHSRLKRDQHCFGKAELWSAAHFRAVPWNWSGAAGCMPCPKGARHRRHTCALAHAGLC